MSNTNQTNESEKAGLAGSTSGNVSSDFRSTNASGAILPEGQGGTVTSGNAGTQGQTGTGARTTTGQAGEGTAGPYNK